MPNVIYLSQTGPLNKISSAVEDLVEEGAGRVVFEFYGTPSFKQIVKTLEWMGDEYALKVSIAHAEFKHFLVHAAAGAAVGGLVALLLKVSGYAITGPMALSIAALMAIWALLATTLHVRIYKFRGNTRLSVAI